MTAGGRRRALVILGAALSWSGLAGPSFGGVLTRVSAASTAAGLELRIYASGFFDSRIFLLDHPNRVILDISGIGESTAAPLTSVNEAGVRSVRTSQFTADVVRIVIDLEGEVPTYQLSRVAAGFLILFPQALASAPPPLEIVAPGPPGMAAVPAKTAPAAPPEAAAPALAPSSIRIVDAPAAALPASPSAKIFRVTAAADLFLFRDEALAAAYGKAANYGGRLDVRLLEFGGLWLGADYCRRSAATAGGTRTIRLIPIEAGIKFIMSRGVLAPYVGFGAAYFLFREETPAGTVSLDAFGLTSTAGILLRLGPSLTIDGYARYRRLPVDLAVRAFDAGGFHFGAGIGLAF
jgi:hypothetical protein